MTCPQFPGLMSLLPSVARKSLGFGTSSTFDSGNGETSYVVGVPSSSQASKSTGTYVNVDFGTDVVNRLVHYWLS